MAPVTFFMTPGQGVADLLGGRLTDEIFAALPAQTVVVTGTNAAGIVLPRLAAQLAALRQQRAEVA